MARNNQHKIDLYFKEFADRIDGVPDIIAETTIEEYKKPFTTKSYNGKRWRAYQGTEPSRGSLLVRSSKLVNSIGESIVSETLVRIKAGSSEVPYAKIHNEGGRIRKKFKVRSFVHPNLFGKGPKKVKEHTRIVNTRIPKRQFMGINLGLKKRLKKRLGDYIKYKK